MPSIGLMTHVPIHASDVGTASARAATSTTMAPIHRAMKSQIVFICYRIASFFRSIMQSYEKTSEIQKKRHFLFISECIVTSVKPKLRKKVEYINAFWKINAIRPEIKAKRGRTWKFKNRDNAKLGGLVKELGCQIVTSFSHLLHLCDEAIEARQALRSIQGNEDLMSAELAQSESRQTSLCGTPQKTAY